MWKKFDSVRDLPDGLWNGLVARGDVCLDARLLAVAEAVLKGYRFHYYAKFDGAAILAVFMTAYDTASGRIGLSTPETSGLHFWFDDTRMSFGQFLGEIECEALRHNPGAGSICFGDFYGAAIPLFEREFAAGGFVREDSLPVSILHVPPGVDSLEGYIASLKYKYRYELNRCRRAMPGERYVFEAVEDYMPMLDELYPLYAAVCRRSKEYAADPHPPEYFAAVKDAFGRDAAALTARDTQTGACLGFMLLLYGCNCVHQYIGFERMDELFLWHNLTTASIGDAIGRGVREINMGVTNAVAKHKFGAETLAAAVFVKSLHR